MSENNTPETGTGYLWVQVTTANTAIPLSNAFVTVSRDNAQNELLYTLRTGTDGRTPRVALPTPPRTDSFAPSDIPPFSTYNITVRAQGYGAANYDRVPIFDGITAFQQADLIPLPANGSPDGFTQNAPQIFGAQNDFGMQGGT